MDARIKQAGGVAFLAVFLLATPAWAGGWYLLSPDVVRKTESTRATWRYDGDLRAWRVVSSHDSAKECETAKNAAIRGARRERFEIGREWATRRDEAAGADARKVEADISQCIATDDPRLK